MNALKSDCRTTKSITFLPVPCFRAQKTEKENFYSKIILLYALVIVTGWATEIDVQSDDDIAFGEEYFFLHVNLSSSLSFLHLHFDGFPLNFYLK